MKARKKLTVAVVCGGRSGEHEVSLVSAGYVSRGLDPRKYRVLPIVISHEGEWRLAALPAAEEPVRSSPSDPRVRLSPGSRPLIGVQRARRETSTPIDVFFPVLHGPYGEDGTIQGLFEMCGAPYVGAGVLASAVGMDKLVMKALFERAGLLVPPYIGFTRADWARSRIEIEERVLGELGLPCFVKPCNGGSSVGIVKVKAIEDFASAVATAMHYDRRIVVERAITGQEIECSVLGNDEPAASLPGEVIPEREYYDYYDKYIGGRTQFKVPADLPHDAVEAVRRASIDAYRAIDCTGMARVDFFFGPGDAPAAERLYVNEINTIPGFTAISMYPKLWGVSGIAYSKLLDRLIALAIGRFRQRSSMKTRYSEGRKLVPQKHPRKK